MFNIFRAAFWAAFGTQHLTFLVKIRQFYVTVNICKIANIIYGQIYFSAKGVSDIGICTAKP